jgi:predicted TIM-barrel fold metal-dependent hydrolase
MTTTKILPPGSWDCHVHCFDPVRFPYRPDRAYTPSPASVASLISWSPCDNIVIVQATIEDGAAGVLAHVAEGRQDAPAKNFYATAVSALGTDRSLLNASLGDVEYLHDAGVRCLRLHAGFGSNAIEQHHIGEALKLLASTPAISRLGCAVCMQMPLRVWAGLGILLTQSDELNTVKIIADHVGSATPADIATDDFAAFLDVVRMGRLYVKISALHRRSPTDVPAMKGIVQELANAAPDRLLWGSDWPHVNSGAKGLIPAPPLDGVDAVEELKLIKTWLSEEQWRKMLVDNPRHVFGGEAGGEA